MDNSEQPESDGAWPLLWRIRLSALYHLKRERFLDGVDRASKAISALSGAAAFSQVKSSPEMGLWLTAFVTLVSTLSLVYGPSSKARKHAELARDYKKLEAEMAANEATMTPEKIHGYNAKFIALESSESAALGALVTQCHNELSVAYGHSTHVTPLPFWQRLFKNWFDFDQSKVSGKPLPQASNS